MKRYMLVSMLLAGCASAPPAENAAPEFELEALEGKRVKGSALWESKPVLLVFMTSWCQACRAEVPLLNELAKTQQVVAISTGDSKEAVERCRQQAGITYPILLDRGECAKAYGIVASPTCILVDPGGRVRYRGAHPPENLK